MTPNWIGAPHPLKVRCPADFTAASPPHVVTCAQPGSSPPQTQARFYGPHTIPRAPLCRTRPCTRRRSRTTNTRHAQCAPPEAHTPFRLPTASLSAPRRLAFAPPLRSCVVPSCVARRPVARPLTGGFGRALAAALPPKRTPLPKEGSNLGFSTAARRRAGGGSPPRAAAGAKAKWLQPRGAKRGARGS